MKIHNNIRNKVSKGTTYVMKEGFVIWKICQWKKVLKLEENKGDNCRKRRRIQMGVKKISIKLVIEVSKEKDNMG